MVCNTNYRQIEWKYFAVDCFLPLRFFYFNSTSYSTFNSIRICAKRNSICKLIRQLYTLTLNNNSWQFKCKRCAVLTVFFSASLSLSVFCQNCYTLCDFETNFFLITRHSVAKVLFIFEFYFAEFSPFHTPFHVNLWFWPHISVTKHHKIRNFMPNARPKRNFNETLWRR